MKYIIATLFVYALNSVLYGQHLLNGRVTSEGMGIDDVLILAYPIGDKENQQKWESTTSKSGDFTLKISKFPVYLIVETRKTGFTKTKRKFLFGNKDKVLNITLPNEYKRAFQRLERAYKELNERLIKKSGENKQLEELLDYASKEEQNLNDSLVVLRNLMIDHQIEIEDALSISNQLERRVQNLEQQNLELKENNKFLVEKYKEAYMQVVEFHCESFKKNKIKVGFNLVDENGRIIIDPTRRAKFRIGVKRIDNTRKQEYFIRNEQNEKYSDFEFHYTGSRIYAEFLSNENRVFLSDNVLKSQNYSILISNSKYMNTLKEVEINNLSEECYLQAPENLKSGFRGTLISVSAIREVSSTDVKLTIWDGGSHTNDGDTIDLYLNDRLILNDFALSKNKEDISLSLKSDKPNLLLVYSENEGKNAGNSASIILNSNEDGSNFSEKVKLWSSSRKTEGLKILVKK